jgi:hypothetical protein
MYLFPIYVWFGHRYLFLFWYLLTEKLERNLWERKICTFGRISSSMYQYIFKVPTWEYVPTRILFQFWESVCVGVNLEKYQNEFLFHLNENHFGEWVLRNHTRCWNPHPHPRIRWCPFRFVIKL